VDIKNCRYDKGTGNREDVLEDVLKVVSRNFHHIVTPLTKGRNKKIQFSPLYKGRVREG
jgi:hypothetical protein